MSGKIVSTAASAGRRPAIRPIAHDRGRGGPALLVVAVLVALLALATLLAWAQDRDGRYPGSHTEESAGAYVAPLPPPTNSAVDSFDEPGPLRSVGSFPWRAASGPMWRAGEGVVRAGTNGGTLTVDPRAADVVVQVEVFRPVEGAGLVFRWGGADDHFGVEVAQGRDAWLLVTTVAGRRTVVDRIDVRPQGSTVTVSLSGSHVGVSVNAGPPVEMATSSLARYTAVGLEAPSDETRFDQFAVLAR